jgi:very-short-patch-repair endonuclease
VALTRSTTGNGDWAAVAATQHGVLSREQALCAGLTRRQIDNRLFRGIWVEVRIGVYRSTSAPDTWHQRAMAACIGRAHALAVSHRSAAYLHGIVERAPEAPDVVAPRTVSSDSLRGIASIHRLRALPTSRELVTIASIPVTSLPRTLVDLAGTTPQRELDELVDKAVRSVRLDWERRSLLRSVHELAAGRRGAAALRSAAAPWVTERGSVRKMQSELEAKVLRILLAAGIPAPACQHRVVLRSGRPCYLDFAWPGARVALEVDGYAFHADRDTFDHDRERGNALLELGWHVVHTTASQIKNDPEGLVDTLRSFL